MSPKSTLCPENDSWDGRYICGITAEEFEHIMLVDIPPRISVRTFCSGHTTSEASGGLTKFSLAEFINNAFGWASSAEGSEYWGTICGSASNIDAVKAVTELRENKRMLKEWADEC